MLETALTAPTGDDVFGEDPTVLELEAYMAELFGKEKGLFVPTSTMANLLAILSHCHERGSEIIIGSNSHISIWEGGNAAGVGGVHTRQLTENPETAQLCPWEIRQAYKDDSDDHYACTKLLCLENTHNLMGGVALSAQYVQEMGNLAHDEDLGIVLHVDGARIFHAAVSQSVSVKELCAASDSVSVCLSKGLGAPLGSVLVGGTELIRLAKRARKPIGGGMRQAGVVAAMGMYAVQNNVERLQEDHVRARRLAEELERNGFKMPRSSVDTNIFFFRLPDTSVVCKEDFGDRLAAKYDVKLGSGYQRDGGELFRVATHMDISDEDIDRAAEAMVQLAYHG